MMIVLLGHDVIAGALTGGWCGDAIQVFLPQLNGFRNAVMWFDPLEKPMHFFYISLALGYLQIIFAIGLAFWHKWTRGDKREAIFDHGTWFVWLNSLMLFGLAKAGLLPPAVARSWLCGAGSGAGIVLFSERQGSWGARIAWAVLQRLQHRFYVADVLSYIRLMALAW
jgi:V/A-type H+-transporting ATPase subunit I